MQLQFPSKKGNEWNKSFHKRSFRSCLSPWPRILGVLLLRSGQIYKEGFFDLFSFLEICGLSVFIAPSAIRFTIFLKMRNDVVFRLPHHFPVVGPVGRTKAQLLNSDRNSYKGWTTEKLWGGRGRSAKKYSCKGTLTEEIRRTLTKISLQLKNSPPQP